MEDWIMKMVYGVYRIEMVLIFCPQIISRELNYGTD